MLMMAPDTDAQDPRILLQDFLSFDTPEGYRAELFDGEIVVTPPPNGNHENAIDQIVWQVFRNSTVEMSFSANKGLIVPSGGDAVSGRVIPDITFAPRDLNLFQGALPWMDPSGVAMIVEVTSSHPERDREGKRRAYAGARIPLYLLVDRREEQAVLLADPDGDDYFRESKAPFGKKLSLPEPFGFELDTGSFAN